MKIALDIDLNVSGLGISYPYSPPFRGIVVYYSERDVRSKHPPNCYLKADL